MKRTFIISSAILFLSIFVIQFSWSPILWSLVIVLPLFFIGVYDMIQKKHAIRRNFPLLGNFRYLLESIGPEINQYFIESNSSGVPFSREQRSLVYQRAKNQLDTLPFGTQHRVNEVGYEWVNHSLSPVQVDSKTMRVWIGGVDCKQPYHASILNISAMSYGALSKHAVLALNKGAKNSGFAHNTGEGGLTEHHLKNGGDLIWQIGTGYFGARTLDGQFDPDLFKEKASHANVKMIEIKLSQGAKPGHGGILPAAKVTKEIAEIRNVPLGKDVNSPPAHSTFSTPMGLLGFVKQLRDLSGGKPVGFKLCVGKRREFLAICKAMVETNILPDYIAVDGGEGGTGSAPLEFSNSLGAPLTEALIFVHNALIGFDLRTKIRIICSGKIVSGFDIVKNMAIGADLCYSARAMMLAIGCIQSLKCNKNTCPTGVATQDPHYMQALNIEDKAKRTSSFHESTVESVAEIIGAMGLNSTNELRPWHRVRRTDFTEIKNYSELFEFLEPGALLKAPYPEKWARAVKSAISTTFQHISIN
ncbi:MAG: FMN-binding glutamate synthase family protein [Bacteroidota bacterium]